MTAGGGSSRLFLVFAAAVLSTFAVHRFLGSPERAVREETEISVPADGLRLAFLAEDLGEIPSRLGGWPVYRGLQDDIRRLATEAGPCGGAVAAYGRHWIAWVDNGRGSAADAWTAVADDDARRVPGFVPRIPASPLPPPEEITVLLRPAGILDAAANRLAPGWHEVLPERAMGTVRGAGSSLRERWRVPCPAPCLLAFLDAGGSDGVPARGWNAVPPDPDALVWLLLDPPALGGATLDRAWPGWAAAERFLDMPLRAALAQGLAGPVVVATADPRDGGIPRLLAVADLRDREVATSALDRLFALGVLSEALELSRYRGVLVGTWRPRSDLSLGPSVAVDGDVLLLALHADDLRDAIDRRRTAGTVRPDARRRLDGLGAGSWKAWSRSSTLAASWEEILSGKRAQDTPAPFEVTAVGRLEGEAWRFRSDGGAPLVAAEPLFPTARAVIRALRGQR